MKYLKLALILINLLALVAQYGVSFLRSDTGPRLSRISLQLSQFEKDNSLLREQIYLARSLTTIELQAQIQALGPVKTMSLAPPSVASSLP